MRTATLTTAVTVMLLGVMVFAQTVTYDFDKTTNFAKFKTYAWVRGTELRDELNHRRVVAAIDKQLAAKGLERVDAAAYPDALVAYHATFDKNLQINGFSSGWGAYRFPGNRSGSARVEEIVVGTIAVDLMDATSKTIVWRSMASKDVDPSANPAKREKGINKAAEKLFKNYPPANRLSYDATRELPLVLATE